MRSSRSCYNHGCAAKSGELKPTEMHSNLDNLIQEASVLEQKFQYMRVRLQKMESQLRAAQKQRDGYKEQYEAMIKKNQELKQELTASNIS